MVSMSTIHTTLTEKEEVKEFLVGNCNSAKYVPLRHCYKVTKTSQGCVVCSNIQMLQLLKFETEKPTIISKLVHILIRDDLKGSNLLKIL